MSPWGAVVPWGDADPVAFDWFVAADDRWHVPAQEPTIRQRRIEGAPVVETRLRIPDGDVVQRTWAVPDGGGTVVIEFENESPMPVAIALAGPHVVTERPPADVAIQGIELPDDAIVMPLGHRATVRVALAGADARALSLGRLPPMLSVVRGWTSVVERASRLVLPDEVLVDAFVAARSDLLLEGPVHVGDDPIGFLLDVGELVRCGDSADAWLLDVVEPTEKVARSVAKAEPDAVVDSHDAIRAARLVAAAAGDQRAVADIDRIAVRLESKRVRSSPSGTSLRPSFADLRRGPSVGRFVRSVERRIASDGRLLVGGMPTGWLGNNFEVHNVPTVGSQTVSFAVRWHGERPAVLWEQHGGEPVTLTAPDIDPDWATDEASGEMLWAAPPTGRTAKRSLTLDVDTQTDTETHTEGGSFS